MSNPMVQTEIQQLADDGKPLDYFDDKGHFWLMCSCGHRRGGYGRKNFGTKKKPIYQEYNVYKIGDKVRMCPNCELMCRIGSRIPIVYSDRVPD